MSESSEWMSSVLYTVCIAFTSLAMLDATWSKVSLGEAAGFKAGFFDVAIVCSVV